jgi:uncharacterized protein YijF (DUF1287 family)
VDITQPQDRSGWCDHLAHLGLANLGFAMGSALRALLPVSLLIIAALAGRAQARPDPAVVRQEFLRNLVAAAIERTHHQVTYDPGYVSIAYPGGDVPADSGVCSDEIIRIYRAVGIDLQKEVHEDIARNFSAYPMSRWQQKRPDRNIDHRRVPNLMAFFGRKGEELAITSQARDYAPGDMVAWDLGNGVLHIGMVVDTKGLLSNRYMIVHNIGAGPQMEDVLFDWKIIGHYRYFGLPPAPASTGTARGGAAEQRETTLPATRSPASAIHRLATSQPR